MFRQLQFCLSDANRIFAPPLVSPLSNYYSGSRFVKKRERRGHHAEKLKQHKYAFRNCVLKMPFCTFFAATDSKALGRRMHRGQLVSLDLVQPDPDPFPHCHSSCDPGQDFKRSMNETAISTILGTLARM